MLTRLRVLDVDVKANREELFNLFIKNFRSTSLVEGYFRSSAYVKAYLFLYHFLLVISVDSDGFWPGLMIAVLGILCIYGFARIIGWMINGLIRK